MRSPTALGRWPGITALVLLAAACNDSPTAPLLPPPTGARFAIAASDSLYHPNSRRYRESGYQPSTGRAGAAALAVQSLIDRAGRTDVRVRAMRADDPWTPAATLQSVQLKGFADDGQLLFTRNATDLAIDTTTLSAAGLRPGSRVQVQGVVSDGSPRAGVVTVDDIVRRRPDLAIVDATLPRRAAINSVPNVRATIRELNGEVGAVAHCALEVNGVEVDRVHGMWVDAGGTVTCQFFHFFRERGSHELRVRVHTEERDWDDANNASATETIRIDPIPSTFYFHASFVDRTFEVSSRSRWSMGTVDGSWGYEGEDEFVAAGRTQDAWMTAYVPTAISFPLQRLQVRQYTRDGTVQGFVLNDVPADWSYGWGEWTESCMRRALIPEFGGYGWVQICSVRGEATEWSPAWGYTWADYYRNAGDVTYYSRGNSRYWDYGAGYEDVWSWNYSGTDQYGRLATYGLEYAFFLGLQDATGAVYRANPFVWLSSEDHEWSSPWQCWSWSDAWYRSESCHESRNTEHVVGGFVYGEPFTP